MAQTAKTTTASKRSPRTLAGAVSPADDPARIQVLANYESAVRLMQEGKFEKARTAFEKLLTAGAGELSDRIRMYINASTAQLSRSKANFENHEERYDYAVSLLNDGHYEDAREQFEEILKQNAEADYALYGLAILASVTGDSHTCLEHLTEAIRRNPRNRIQARADSDFQNMADDPRFTELLYPEI
ncbi:TPR end-of-group domain-containing protein [Edaphobacter albus]|uniref:TPR end-of-group domain-containing protein n=1 Tax=Edaphobacter sp. 4G125 TaxID=2763071 RepID=UPI001645C087|nr:tetratricopeptide repeat protein [Edaphobacter sp. 4G125]QNI35504.1 tetratricopeptide repeat protein [Edaphobacter sp. 4G125]